MLSQVSHVRRVLDLLAAIIITCDHLTLFVLLVFRLLDSDIYLIVLSSRFVIRTVTATKFSFASGTILSESESVRAFVLFDVVN